MRVLVAGGAGFIGSHLVRRLLSAGNDVLCVDNLLTGRRKNIAALEDIPGFTFVEADVTDDLPDGPRVDQIFHLASPASPPGYRNHPIATMRANAEGTRRLLERAIRDDASFLFCSTSEAYGDPLEHPQREDYRGNVSSTGPRSMYDESKRYGEAMTMAFARSYGAKARIVRIFNTYGPFSDPCDGRLVPNFITQALANVPMTVYANGEQTRSLCYVGDLVEGLILTMGSPEAIGRVINLGNPDEHTVLEFATIIRELVGSSSPLTFSEPAVGDDPQRRRPDIGLAQALLGWEPKTSLRDGLERTIAYFRQELTHAASAQPQVDLVALR